MSLLDVLKTPAARVPHHVPCGSAISDLPDPDEVTIPLEYPEQLLLHPQVKAGDVVARRQVIGRSESGNCIHASLGGTVREISRIWTASGHHVPAVVIERGNVPDLIPADALAHCGLDPASATRLQLLMAGGVISPWTTPVRENDRKVVEAYPEIRHVVILGHDEEPTQHVQELLLQERHAVLINGLRLLGELAPLANITLTVPRRLLGWARETFGDDLHLEGISTDYRRRLARVLVPKLTRTVIPANMPYRSRGVAVLTVETVLAAQEAVEGRPQIHKTLSISGGPLAAPLTVRVPLGSSINYVLAACGLDNEESGRVLAGGPMQGMAIFTEDTPLDKFQNGIHLLRADELLAKVNLNCVSCGRCVRACPTNLQVHLIGRSVEFNLQDYASELHSEFCIECGLCAFVCPARRPLVQLVKLAKTFRRRSS